MNEYYNGLKQLVPFAEYVPSYPATNSSLLATSTASSTDYAASQTPQPFSPYPDFETTEYLATHAPVKTCFIDHDKKVAAPDIYTFAGVPQGQPLPAMGSHSLLGIKEDICYDRYGRYAPYGLGYGEANGGLNVGVDLTVSDAGSIWDQMGGAIDYRGVDWANLQQTCYELNEERFTGSNNTALKPIARQAVVIRIWDSFEWSDMVILNFRAMINELSLRSGGEYDLHFLMHVKNDQIPIWASKTVHQAIIDRSVPAEFRGLVTLWSEQQMELIYNRPISSTFDNPSGQKLHGAYRSLHMPLQWFAHEHQEYEHFWNWEMDMRYTGHFYELFDRMGAWARQQSRKGLWERSAKFYIPQLHGSWENFTRLVEEENAAGNNIPISGPVVFPGSPDLTATSSKPASCAMGENPDLCGVGEDADLITLNPIFDPVDTRWVFRDDVAGYDRNAPIPPRRVAIVTAGRLSRRLLGVMHEETYLNGHSMFAEMFPPSMALHHGLKAVFVPHPVYVDRDWPAAALESAFNNGTFGSSGGAFESPFSIDNEHFFQGTTWYFNSGFAGALWRRWLGYKENQEGGREAEDKVGRMCMRGVLLHPIKFEMGFS